MIRTPDEPGVYRLPLDPPIVSLKLDLDTMPWRFRGPDGSVTLHPQAVVYAIEGRKIYNEITGTFIADGSQVEYVVLSRSSHVKDAKGYVCVLDTPEQVEEQVRNRGGWKAIP